MAILISSLERLPMQHGTDRPKKGNRGETLRQLSRI
jgi:hypothetical protein